MMEQADKTYSFVYGMRMLPSHAVDAVYDAKLVGADGAESHVTMHLIEGSREQIRRTLLQSVDAFFELHE